MRNGESTQAEALRTLTSTWSDKEADQVYSLNTFAEYTNGERELRSTITGDKAWAERIAKHYGLTLPEETK